jgi:hypothetical protein
MTSHEITFQAFWRASMAGDPPRARVIPATPARDGLEAHPPYVAVTFAGFWIGFESIDDVYSLRDALDAVIPEAVAAGVYPMHEPDVDADVPDYSEADS